MKHRKFLTPLSAITLALLTSSLIAPSVWAQNNTNDNLPISSKVANSCIVNSTDSLSFGTYVPSNPADLTSQGAISLNCTKGAVVNVAPSSGNSSLTGANGSLNFGLFTDSAMSQPWGSAPTYTTLTFGTGKRYFNNLDTNVSASQCAAIAGSNLYAYWSYKQYCFSNYTTNTTNYYVGPVQNQGDGLQYQNGTVVMATNPGAITYVMPNDSTAAGSNYTYSVKTGGGTNPLSGTASSAHNPLVLNYYAKLPAGQDVGPGTYTSTVLLNVSF